MAISKDLLKEHARAVMKEDHDKTIDEIERIKVFPGEIDLYKSMDAQEAEYAAIENRNIQDISVADIDKFAENPFPEAEGEEREEFIESVKNAGIIEPLIVRKVGSRYQLLSGHRRLNAAKEIGLKKVPCEVRILSDDEAVEVVGVANLKRKDIDERVWGMQLKLHNEELKRSVGRHKKDDNEEVIKMVPNSGTISGEPGNEETEEMVPNSGTISKKKKTMEILGDIYGFSKGKVSYLMRLAELTDELYAIAKENGYTQEIKTTLSYLSKASQEVLTRELPTVGNIMSPEMAAELRDVDKQHTITATDVVHALPVIKKEKTPTAPRPKRYVVNETLFPGDLKKGLRESYIERALEYIRDNKIVLKVTEGDEAEA